MNILSAKAISVYFEDIQAQWDMSFSVPSGQIVALLGTNGAGKTTTLKTICGLLSGASGQIEFEGKPISGLPVHEI
ncbi:MAG: ATP-binding cassette domain-containing protein, partial [Desulfatirhabdiaceae bacterium]|nr:ATP-binding cassette domain-containing protein [Desulfatirhabdiaceae bacterium]